MYNTTITTATININNINIIENIVPTKAPVKLSPSVFLSASFGVELTNVELMGSDVESNVELVISTIVVTACSNNRNRIHINYLKQS